MLKTTALSLLVAVVAGGVYLPMHVHEQTVNHLSEAGFVNVSVEAATAVQGCPTTSLFNSRFKGSDPFGKPVAGHVCRAGFDAPSQIHLLPGGEETAISNT